METEALTPPKVFLTFDDGPNEPYTSQILDILKEFDIRATFFVCGKNVEHYPEVVKRMVREGHVVGNHTYSHSRILTYASFLAPKFLISEIEKTAVIIQRATGITTKLFRPPWGILAPSIQKYLRSQGYKIVYWDIASCDWKKISAKTIEKNVVDNVKPDSIVLFHDGGEDRFHKNHAETVLALRPIIQNAQSRGYAFEKT
ncbi:MAG: polysaccharide deacetylase family protein [Candidatus Spechtbacteria bacterium]|nr:polysaccharide deacetylase family protein [Candidatus Spechtbacteria bacterium]